MAKVESFFVGLLLIGCMDSSAKIPDAAQPPTAAFAAPAMIHERCPAKFSNTSQHADGYRWTFGAAGEFGTSTESEPIAFFPKAGNAKVALTATGGGQSASSSQDVLVRQVPGFQILNQQTFGQGSVESIAAISDGTTISIENGQDSSGRSYTKLLKRDSLGAVQKTLDVTSLGLVRSGVPASPGVDPMVAVVDNGSTPKFATFDSTLNGPLNVRPFSFPYTDVYVWDLQFQGDSVLVTGEAVTQAQPTQIQRFVAKVGYVSGTTEFFRLFGSPERKDVDARIASNGAGFVVASVLSNSAPFRVTVTQFDNQGQFIRTIGAVDLPDTTLVTLSLALVGTKFVVAGFGEFRAIDELGQPVQLEGATGIVAQLLATRDGGLVAVGGSLSSNQLIFRRYDSNLKLIMQDSFPPMIATSGRFGVRGIVETSDCGIAVSGDQGRDGNLSYPATYVFSANGTM